MKLTKKTWPVFVLVGISIPVTLIFLFFVLAFVFLLPANKVDRMEFDAAVWKSTPAEMSFESVRLRMVDSLLDRRVLNGKTRTEIVELLGEPDEARAFTGYDMVWWLGPERGFMSIDSEWLWIDLDENEVAIDVRLGAD